DLEPAPLAGDQRHADGGVGEGAAETLLALAQGGGDAALLGDVARHRLGLDDAPALEAQLYVLADPELAAIAGDRRELEIGAGQTPQELPPAVLGDPLVVVGP